MAGKKLINPYKAQFFVWKPKEGFNLDPRFFTGTPCKPKKSEVQKGNKIC
jgi:hypothetical protein